MFFRFFVYMDEQDIQDLAFGACSALFPGIGNPVRDHRRSQLPLQLRPVLSILCILCILCIDVLFVVLLDRSHPSRPPAVLSAAIPG